MFLPTDHISHYRSDAEIFDYFKDFSPVNADGARRIQQAVFAEACIPANGLILDAGSGNGWLVRRIPEGGPAVVCLDLGMHNLKKIKEIAPHALCVCSSLERLPFRSGVFERVVCSEVLEHTVHPETLVSACTGVLVSKGRFIASTPYREKIRETLCIHCNRPTPVNAHLHSFDENRHHRCMATAGLSDLNHKLIQNKYFMASRLSWLLRALPFRLWRILDAGCNLLAPKAATIVVSGVKHEKDNRGQSPQYI